MAKNDLTGKKYGRLTVLEENGRTADRHVLWKCRCDCGNVVSVPSRDLIMGHTKSCGCLKKELTSERRLKHGAVGNRTHVERLYKIWISMRQRCFNSNNHAYQYYGGRGISICDDWADYSMFRNWAYKNGYNDLAKTMDCTIDRINNDGDYSPTNCRWVGMNVQNQNKRKSG